MMRGAILERGVGLNNAALLRGKASDWYSWRPPAP